jgi:hypothetical protein
MSPFRSALLAATLIVAGAGGLAYAQAEGPFDLSQLPAIKGKVAQYLPTPRGEVDGLLLEDGTEVHVPPHLSTQLVFAVKPGDNVTVHGLKARAVPLVAAATITNDATNVTISWGGPPRREEQQVEAQGRVKAPLYDPRGEVDGVLLEDGTVVHLPPTEVRKLADTLAVGKAIVARGDGYSGALGRAIGARQIGPDAAHLTEIRGPRPPWGGPWAEHWMHERMAHAMPGHGEMVTPGPDGAGAPPPPPPAQ